jgi:hypothetical protein
MEGDADPVFFPRGVADPGGRAGYVGDGAGIVAVGLRDGELLWRTDRAEQPLISDGKRLAASVPGRRPNVIEVVLRDARRQGELLLVSEPIVFPEWATVAPQPRETFRASAHVEGNRLRLEWQARTRYGGGAAPGARIRREAAREAAGVVEVDLDTGAVAPLPADRDPDGERAAIRRPPLDDSDLDERWLAGTTVARLVWDVDDADQVLGLETFDATTGHARTLVELARGQGLVAQVTPDGCYLLVHREQGRAGGAPWWVFSTRTGGKVATLPHDAGAHVPAILEDRAYYLVEPVDEATPARALRARELGDGTLVWESPLAPRRRSAAPRLRQ